MSYRYFILSSFVHTLTNLCRPPTDDVLAKYEEHEDSVYAVTWSTADAWVFASLSYDGRFVINHVPSQEKLAILTY